MTSSQIPFSLDQIGNPQAKTMDRILRLMAERGASDVYLSAKTPILVRISGQMMQLSEEALRPDQTFLLISELLRPDQIAELEEQGELNVGIGLSGVGSFRLSAFRQRGTIAAVLRCVTAEIPSLEAMGLPPVLGQLILEKRGLILICGATGQGKSTTMAAMLEERNRKVTGHILTIEDPIEYLFTNNRSIVNQREVGRDTKSLHTALRNALRQAPDCIMIGEIRDRETMANAIAYSLSGHLVIATLHANNSYQALSRVVSFFPAEVREPMLHDLSTALRAVVTQRLLRSTIGGRVPAVEILINSQRLSELIHAGDIDGVRDAMQTTLSDGSQTFDDELVKLILGKIITREEALAHADSSANLIWRLDNDQSSKKAAQANARAEPAVRPGQHVTDYQELFIDVPARRDEQPLFTFQ
ncbi:PilT/PilU family type 4a pilus ATPase [Amphibiibacter pelophylacis]|uniref:PilT/PilU family type 4a pilus ATPase n=1 Tax=Amphibiibacter pelophylacis TaxID=1799477 RepID=A0ACC6P337_9BURK